MKEPLSPMLIMERMVEALQKMYPKHPKKAEGIIQFLLKHNGSIIECYIKADFNELKFFEGIADNPDVTVKSTFYNWLDLAGGRLNPVWGVITGKLRFKGNTGFFDVLPKKTFNNNHLIPTDPVSRFEKNPTKYWEIPKKVVVLNASPRGNKGYTDFFLKPFIAGMKKKTNVEVVYLDKFDINPCKGCFACWMDNPQQCIYHDADDFHTVAEKLRDADLIVYAFPIYTDSIPGILKNYFDRSVSRAYPYIIQGKNRVRHPRKFIKENQSMVVFSICGFFKMINFEPVSVYFNALAHNRHCPLVGEIYRPAAVGLYGNPFLFKKYEQVMAALKDAGEEVVTNGKIKQKTIKKIHQKIKPKSRDLNKVNEWWIEKKGSGDYNY